MKINEGMRDAIETIVDAARTIDESFDGYPDNQPLHPSDVAKFEKYLERIHNSLYHLQRHERGNK